MPTLIAIGGGGAIHGTHPELDRLCLDHAVRRPRVGYIGTANGDDPEKFDSFCSALAPMTSAIRPLSSGADAAAAALWAERLDLIYVAGGNPVVLVDHWNAAGISDVLINAFRRGVVLAGVSAGAMCWFESFLWRTPENGLQVARGLGLIEGTFTPHSSTEPERRAQMQERAKGGEIAGGYAVDDGAALVFRGGTFHPYPPEGPPRVYGIDAQGSETILGC